jgi:2-dehydro-3-deoxyphosphooctonate aldolase (KDO 8-P synthase)
VFKASFDKANRTSVKSYRGLTLEESLVEFSRIKETYGLPVITDIHEPAQAAPLSRVVDVLQIPAFLCRQTDLVVAAAETQTWVMIKKGQFVAPHDIGPIVEKFIGSGNRKLMICDRGFSFGYNRLINDMGGLYEMRGYGVPICFDATHSVQEPGANKSGSGGHPHQIPALARAAVAVGIDALFMEVHPRPSQAMSDASTVFPLQDLMQLIQKLVQIDRLVKSEDI